jgi:hypothetical protein
LHELENGLHEVIDARSVASQRQAEGSASVASETMLSPFRGTWTKGAISADGATLTWRDGRFSIISIDGDKITLYLDGKVHEGQMDENRIYWSDGDIWEREAESSGTIGSYSLHSGDSSLLLVKFREDLNILSASSGFWHLLGAKAKRIVDLGEVLTDPDQFAQWIADTAARAWETSEKVEGVSQPTLLVVKRKHNERKLEVVFKVTFPAPTPAQREGADHYVMEAKIPCFHSPRPFRAEPSVSESIINPQIVGRGLTSL